MELFEIGEALCGGLETLFLSFEGFAEDLLGAGGFIVSCIFGRWGLGRYLICWAEAPLFLTRGGPREDSIVGGCRRLLDGGNGGEFGDVAGDAPVFFDEVWVGVASRPGNRTGGCYPPPPSNISPPRRIVRDPSTERVPDTKQ